MSLAYRTMYRLGLTPWDQPHPHGPLVELLDTLPPGALLDVGCGTGRDVVFAAGRGWRSTGVDVVPRALETARRRAADAGVRVNLVRADIGRAGPDEVGSGYTLVQDVGCLHGMPPADLRHAAATIDAVSAPGAVLQMLAFAPRRGVGPHGLDRDGVTGLFPQWRLDDSQRAAEVPLRGPMRDAQPYWYRLVRR
jgi:SAM-dependent methyltransferase